MKYCFGIDIGGTTVKAGLFTEQGEEAGFMNLPTRKGKNGAFLYDDAASMVRTMLCDRGIPESDVLGVGLTVPAPVYGDGRMGFANNLDMLGGYPAEEVSGRLDRMKTVVVNDANAAGLGEFWMGAGKGCRSLCMVTLGTGVGGAIIVDGKVVEGKHGAAGEIGHIFVEPEEKERCNCGGCGCCEFYASATGIVRVAKRMLYTGSPVTAAGCEGRNAEMKNAGSRLAALADRLTAKDVCELAKEGDAIAVRSLDFSMDRLARALAAAAATVDPEIFVIGGGVAAAGEILTDRIRDGITRYAPLIREKDHKVVPAVLGNKAGMYGAARLTLGNRADW